MEGLRPSKPPRACGGQVEAACGGVFFSGQSGRPGGSRPVGDYAGAGGGAARRGVGISLMEGKVSDFFEFWADFAI